MSWLDTPLTVTAGAVSKRARLGDYLDAAAAEASAERAIAWIKAIRRLRVDGVSFRDRFTYRSDSLWWFAELYLHKGDQVARWFAAISALRAALAIEGPHSLGLETGDGWLQHVAREVARADGSRIEMPRMAPASATTHLRDTLRSSFLFWSAYWSRQRPSRVPSPGTRGGITAFVHGAFWRKGGESADGEEGYIGPVLHELQARRPGSVHMVGVGPLTNFRARRWWQAVTEAPDTHLPFVPIERLVPRAQLAPSLEMWRLRAPNTLAMRASEELRAHARVDGVDLWPLVVPELEGIAALQFPWSCRTLDEAGTVMDTLAPSAVVTYAEAGGWGRALMLEARRRGIPSAGLQHGFIYRHWLNYRHAADEMEPSPTHPADVGFPRPDRTLLFDAYAKQHLETAGAFPPPSVRVTGSPKLDQMAREVRALDEEGRARARASVGASADDRIVLVATKHAQMHRVFGALVKATGELPRTRLVVKCHPAETAEPYERDAAGATHVTIAPPGANLSALVAVADVVATVNSTVAIDAMVFGVPALVVDLPNNLSPFVDRGLMAGARTGDDIAGALLELLEDPAQRARLAVRHREFLAEFVPEPDGGAAIRAAEAVLELVDRPAAPDER